MRAKLAILVLSISLAGCSSFKESVGQYVTEAVHQKVITDVDEMLEKRGLSRAEIKDVIDKNNDGIIDRKEILETTKEATRDAVLLEAKKMVDSQIISSKEGYVDKGALNSVWHQLWLAVLGLVSAYLGKQVYSAKQDGRRDQKIAVIEKLLQRDIDGDGTIGGVEESLDPETTA